MLQLLKCLESGDTRHPAIPEMRRKWMGDVKQLHPGGLGLPLLVLLSSLSFFILSLFPAYFSHCDHILSCLAVGENILKLFLHSGDGIPGPDVEDLNECAHRYSILILILLHSLHPALLSGLVLDVHLFEDVDAAVNPLHWNHRPHPDLHDSLSCQLDGLLQWSS